MMREVDTLVIGAGPVGLLSAWARGERERVALAVERMPARSARPVLEVVPPMTVALLRQTVGVVAGIVLCDEPRIVAWGSGESAVAQRGFVVDRSELDAAIAAAVLRSDRVIPVAPVDAVGGIDREGKEGLGPFVAAGLRAVRVVDASGRASVTAALRHRIKRPWTAHSFWTARPARVPVGLRVASLPTGYVVRIVSRAHAVVTIVSPSKVQFVIAAAERAIKEHARFVLEGVPALAKMRKGERRRATVEVFEGPLPRVGDASFARDALSSQGLAAGLSEALYASAVRSRDDDTALRERQKTELAKHLRHLTTSIAECRFADAPAWRDYGQDVADLSARVLGDTGFVDVAAETVTSFLVDGRIVRALPNTRDARPT